MDYSLIDHVPQQIFDSLEKFKQQLDMKDSFLNINVTDRQSFIKLIESMHEDLQINPGNWENKNLSDFLEAMGRYVEGIQGYYDNTNQDVKADVASWRLFGDIFKGSTMFE